VPHRPVEQVIHIGVGDERNQSRRW
jgi:hypothetical protein